MFQSLRWRIALPYSFLILVSFLALGVYVTRFARQTYLNDLEKQLSREARLVAEYVTPYIENDSDIGQIDALTKRLSQAADLRVTIIAKDGVVIGESHEDRVTMDNHLNRPEIVMARQNGSGSSTRYSATLGEFLTYTAVPVNSTSGLIGYARVSLPQRDIEHNVRVIQLTLVGTTLAVTLAVILLAFGITSLSLRPLRELTVAARQISAGEYQRLQIAGTLSASSQDEIGQLTKAVNSMISAIQAHIRELEVERTRITSVLEVMTDGVLIVDDQGLVQMINATAESLFGVTKSEAIGHSLAQVLRHHELIELCELARRRGESQTAALEIIPAQLYVQGTATPVGKNLPGTILMLFRNLTRLRQLETMRRDFISNISHELRTPLASLKALTETLQEGALEDPPAARRFLERIETEVDALSQVVSELLELSRIESGQVPLKKSAISPNDLIDSAIDRLRLQAERAGLTVTTSCPVDLTKVLADPTRLEQVLVNLLHNSIKFTPSGGEIEVGARDYDPNHIVFWVKDTGVGIPADDLPRIFERFYKADRARSGGGTGLGLAISRHLVEAHEGRILAESIEGKGSTFSFTIPKIT